MKSGSPSHRPSAAESRPPEILATRRSSAPTEGAAGGSRGSIVLALFVALLALGGLLGPRVGYRLAKTRTLRLQIVDKTVPHRNYREHDLLPWFLAAERLVGHAGHSLTAESDYVGFDPVARQGTRLTSDMLRDKDALYVADTYGVYTGDYAESHSEAALERSRRIFGGIEDSEVAAIAEFASRGGTVIAEFNTFASPTESGPRTRMESLLGVTWTRWIARHWNDLQSAEEVPRWIGHLYERIYGRPFHFAGPGLVFIKDEEDIVVLEDGIELNAPRVSIRRSTTSPDLRDLPEGATYSYWMDILVPTSSEVVYAYRVHTTDRGRAKLAEHGIPTMFPAVTRALSRPNVWYFAGDFVDNTEPRGDATRLGLLPFRRALSSLGLGSESSRFLWGFYVPLLEHILLARAR